MARQAAVTRSELEDADPADAFQQALSGSLHQETRVFDFGRDPVEVVQDWLFLDSCVLY